jgi:hypothetical protein
MKTQKRSLLTITCSFLIFITLLQCDKGNEQINKAKGKVLFGINNQAFKSTETNLSDEDLILQLIVVNDLGEPILENVQLPLLNFGGTLITDPIELQEGNYEIIEYFVISTNTNQVIYASPIEGSNLNYLVEDPLPISFSVVEDDISKVEPQVIDVTNISSNELGYSSFSIDIIETLQLLISVSIFNEETQNYEFTTADCFVTTSQINYYSELPSGISEYILPSQYEVYDFLLIKPGYEVLLVTFSRDSLMYYNQNTNEVINFTLFKSPSLPDSNIIAVLDSEDSLLHVKNEYLPLSLAELNAHEEHPGLYKAVYEVENGLFDSVYFRIDLTPDPVVYYAKPIVGTKDAVLYINASCNYVVEAIHQPCQKAIHSGGYLSAYYYKRKLCTSGPKDSICIERISTIGKFDFWEDDQCLIHIISMLKTGWACDVIK